MIARRVLVNLVVFLVLTGLLISYAAFRLLGNPFASTRTVYVLFDDASGLRKDFSVSLNGVIVGTVRKLSLDDGHKVRVTIALDPTADVPSNVEARIIRASPVGEQRIDFTSKTTGDTTPIRSGAVVPTAADAVPPDVSQLVDVAAKLLKSIPPDDLNTMLHELATGLRGRSEDLRTIIESNDLFAQAFNRHQASFRQLLDSSQPLLKTLADDGPALRQAIANTVGLTQALADSRGDLTQLFRNGARLGDVGGDIVSSELPNLACVVSDVADLTRLVAQPPQLAELQAMLSTNQWFFGPVERLTTAGPTKANAALGLTGRPDQVWLRVRVLLPPPQPSADPYNPKRPTPPTKPGAACRNNFGQGVGPVTQPDAVPPAKGGTFQSAPQTSGPTVTPGPDTSIPARPAAARRDAGNGLGATQLVLVLLGVVVVGAMVGVTPSRRLLYWRPWR